MEYNLIEIVRERKSKEGDIKIPEGRLVNMNEAMRGNMHIGIPMNENNESLSGKAIWLDYDYDWVLGKTMRGSLVCIPLKKED